MTKALAVLSAAALLSCPLIAQTWHYVGASSRIHPEDVRTALDTDSVGDVYNGTEDSGPATLYVSDIAPAPEMTAALVAPSHPPNLPFPKSLGVPGSVARNSPNLPFPRNLGKGGIVNREKVASDLNKAFGTSATAYLQK